MPPRDYQRPRDRNKLSLTVKQHVFPRASLERFCSGYGGLEIFDKLVGKRRRARSDDHLFMAMRRWDQRAETGYMRGIEDQFQRLAEDIIHGDIGTLDHSCRDIVQRFYALWGLRGHFKEEPTDSVRLNGFSGIDSEFSADEIDYIEKRNAVAIQPDGTISGRHLTGIFIQLNIDRMAEEGREISWGIAKSYDGQFLAPDRPFAMFVPLTPTIMLIGNSPNGIVKIDSLRDFNRRVIYFSHRFYFAQDMAAAPV